MRYRNHKNFLLLFIGCFFIIHVQAQEKLTDSLPEKTLEEIVISGYKFPEKKKNIAQKIDLISSRYIGSINAQNTGDLLMSTGNVFVQKSQQGGGSPVIRGFEASRVLLIIDGVRMNNLIYRSGHLQNAISVDQNMLEGVEVMYGPASTLYGSDALGGAIYFKTRQPQLMGDSNKRIFKGNYFTRYSSVNHEKTIHADLNIGAKKWAWLQSFTLSEFGDLMMGRNGHPDYPSFGLRDSFITQINGRDTVISNRNPFLQKFSAYTQWDILQKILYQPSSKTKHILNLQYSSTTPIPRYDRLQDKRDFGGSTGQTLRWADWYYGPQTRFLSAYEMQRNATGFFDEARILLSYQHIEESRYQREFKRYDRLDGRKEKVDVAGWVLDLRKNGRKHEWTVGTDGQWNTVHSTAKRTDIRNGYTEPLDTRYPDGTNIQWSTSFYVQHLYKLHKKWILNDGIRGQYIHLHSTLLDNRFFNLPFQKIIQKNVASTGNMGLIFLPEANSRVSLSFAAGFRAPNIDDLAKIFESNTERNQLVVPNPGIRPERTYNFELNLTKSFQQKIKIDCNLFYTRFSDALVKAPFPLNGNDSVLYNGVMSQTLANLNAKKAFLYGYSLTAAFHISRHIKADASIHTTKGRFLADPERASEVYEKQNDGRYALVTKFVHTIPLDHIPPTFGRINISYQRKKITAALFMIWNSAKGLSEYNPDGEDNVQYASPAGALAWQTINLNFDFQPVPNCRIQIALENMMDTRYRIFASGQSAGGRNISCTLRYSH